MTTDNLLFDALQQIDADKPFSDQELDKIDTIEKKKRRQEKREKRRNDCGKWSYWFNPHSGKKTGFTFKCGLFRECPTCLETRANKEYEWIQETSLHKRMVVVSVDSKHATKLLRDVDKSDYLRFPQVDNDILIVNEDIGIEGVPVDMEWVLKQDWEVIVNTPEGRNKSGTIHQPIADEEPEDFSIITTKQFITNANRSRVIKAMREAEVETKGLNPTNADEVVVALKKRIKIATGKLRAEGFKITIYNKQLKVVHGDIDWLGVNKRVNTKNSTRVLKPTVTLNANSPPVS